MRGAWLLVFALAAGPALAAEEEFVLVQLKSGHAGAQLTPAELAAIGAGHMANIRKLADERKLVVAGPYGTPKHDATLRGVFIFDVRTVAEARALAATDPGVKAGVFALEACRMRTAAPLRKTLEFERDDRAAAKKSGKEPKLADTIRGYVLLTVKNGAGADGALAALRKQGKVAWSGALLDDRAGQAVHVLDAADVPAAEKLLQSVLPQLGEHTLDSWWSTKNLQKLAPAP